MTQAYKIAGVGSTGQYMTVNGTRIWLGATYTGAWRGAEQSLSFNMGSGAALPRLNIMESGTRYEPLGPNNARSLSYLECWIGGYCDAEGHIATLPPDATSLFLHLQSFQNDGYEVHYGDYRLEWAGPDLSYTLGLNILEQGVLSDGMTRYLDFRFDAEHRNPRFGWPDPAAAGDYPRIRRILRKDRIPLYDSGARWNPDFIAEVDGSMAYLRMMDVMGTNNSPITAFAQIPPATSPRKSPWSPEIYADLCNQLGVDCWICIPHGMALTGAPGEVVTADALALVARVDALLHPDLKIYVEYSNEYWNSAFVQFADVWSAATAAGWDTTGGFHPSFYGAKIQTRLFKALKDAFGPRAASRLVCVAASQAANPAITRNLLDGQRWQAEEGAGDWIEPASVCDAVAVAPYLGSSWITTAGEVQSLIARIDAGDTQEQINTYMVGRLQALGLDTQPITWINNQADTAESFGLPLISYEGGTHVLHYFNIAGVSSADVDKIAPYLIEFSYSLAHWSLQEPIMDAWKQRAKGTFDLFSLFYTPNRFGAWGHKRQLGLDTPGELAKEAWQTANPRWWDDWRDFALPPRP